MKRRIRFTSILLTAIMILNAFLPATRFPTKALAAPPNRPLAEIIFTDDFEERQTENWSLDRGWRIRRDGRNIVLSGEGHSWARLKLGADWRDYALRFRLNRLDGGVHVNYRVSEAGRYFVAFGAEEILLHKEMPSGVFVALARSDRPVERNVWHEVQIIGQGAQLDVFVDRELVLAFTDTRPLSQGSVAFETLEAARAYIDDVSVELLGAPQQPALTELQQNARLKPILTPVFMYFVERYFADTPEQTDTDRAIKAILDESDEGQALLRRALERYQAIPTEAKLILFDSEIVRATMEIAVPLNLDFVQGRLSAATAASIPSFDPPTAPSTLTAKNASSFEPINYAIELKWQDNAGNEDGFLIYRLFNKAGMGGGGVLQQIASVGANVTTYEDTLTQPANKADQYCYQVMAYRFSPLALAGQPPAQLTSTSSNLVCAYYEIGYPPVQLPDADQDGIPDAEEQCAGMPGVYPHGCPDKDSDGTPDHLDMCETEPGETLAPGDQGPLPAQAGCPIRYNLRWMGMKVLNNTGAYAYPGYNFVDPFGKTKGLYGNEVDTKCDYGEEPYLVFMFVNGMEPGGMARSGTARWCCGDKVDVKKGQDSEPDSDLCAEEFPQSLSAIQQSGLTIFPAFAGKFAPIDGDLGLAMTFTLMERDYEVTITPEKEADGLKAAFEVGGAVVGAIAGCVGSGGFGCLASVGSAMKSLIESLFGLLESGPPPITIQDPDDYMGTDAWAITRYAARMKTSKNGVYAFTFPHLPNTYYKSCLGWQPCPAGAGVPTTMRVQPYFCLYREGIAESNLKKLCSSYTMEYFLATP